MTGLFRVVVFFFISYVCSMIATQSLFSIFRNDFTHQGDGSVNVCV